MKYDYQVSHLVGFYLKNTVPSNLINLGPKLLGTYSNSSIHTYKYMYFKKKVPVFMSRNSFFRCNYTFKDIFFTHTTDSFCFFNSYSNSNIDINTQSSGLLYTIKTQKNIGTMFL